MDGRHQVFDPVRKKFVAYTPEEHVRQQLLHYLIHEKGYPQSLLSVEKALTVNDRVKRTDIVAFEQDGKPFLLVECKAPGVAVTDAVFMQAAIYNFALKVPYLLVSNGSKTWCASINWASKTYVLISDIPAFRK